MAQKLFLTGPGVDIDMATSLAAHPICFVLSLLLFMVYGVKCTIVRILANVYFRSLYYLQRSRQCQSV